MRKRYYLWDEFLFDIERITKILRPKKFQSLVLISRGGLVPGGLLARSLDICHVEVVCLQSYVNQESKGLQVIGTPFWHTGITGVTLKNSLIVDDICDSGETLTYITSFVKAPVFTLFYKVTQGVFTPTYYLHKTTKWVQFPWE